MEINMKKLLTIALLLTMTSAFADNKGPSWNFLELSYLDVDVDDTDFSPSGFGIGGSALITDEVFLFASYADASETVFGEDIDISTTILGVGYRFEVNDTSDFALGLGYADAEACLGSFGCADDNGYAAIAIFATRIADNVELSFGAEYVDIADESSTGTSITASYYFTDGFSLGLGWGTDDDVDTLSLNAKFHF